MCLVRCYIIEEGCKKTGEVGLFHLNDLNDATFEPGLTSKWGSSLRGRRSKGKGKGFRARNRAP